MDAGLLRNWLGDIKTWLDQNENDVITILLVNVNNATASELDSEFRASNITSYAYEPESLDSAPPSWPTLQSMIDAGKRLVVFVPGLSTRESFPYLMDEWDFVWENPYDVRSPSEFSCNAERPSTDISTLAASKRLPLMNHFLYSNDISELGIEYPNSSYITTTNAASGGTGNLGITAANCKTRWGRSPAFILVDFFNHGPAIETVDS
ncbi:hypothetical protein PITC_094490 [Penicillium italicum]|uniref:Uncharacterized protein n=1 Tax=Penicillium italicum TaxID=40296 RepID=A0A0A2KTA6_PENIT|nr:hypothetical protein PITC_094490 [Penicillium italicum]